MIIKCLSVIAGWILVVAGVILFILPVPLGLPVILLGLFLLIRHSYKARRSLVRFSRRPHWAGRQFDQLRSRRKLARLQR